MLAPAWTRSSAVGLSNGGSGQPALQRTAPETIAAGAARANATCRVDTASSASAAAISQTLTR